MKLTDARKAAFLKALATTGSAAAASAATPWSESSRHDPGLTTFRDARDRDPQFAAAWQAAEDQFMATVEAEIVRRAMEPPKRPVWSKGEVVGFQEDRNSSDKLLLRIAARLDPTWRERQTVDTTVEVRGALLTISPSDVLLLAEPQQRALLDLLQVIAKRKDDEDGLRKLPPGSTPTIWS